MEIKDTISNIKVINSKDRCWLSVGKKLWTASDDKTSKRRGWKNKKNDYESCFWFLVRARGRCWIGYEKPSWTRNCLINGSPRVHPPNPQPMNADQRCKIKHRHSIDEGKFSFSGTRHMEWSYFLEQFGFCMFKIVHSSLLLLSSAVGNLGGSIFEGLLN